MKKIINTAFIYLCFSLFSGVFYREFTKFSNYTGETTLSVTHGHLFALGTIFMLVIGLYYDKMGFETNKRFRQFFLCYNIALPLMVGMFYVKGILQVFGVTLNKAMSASIAGVSGLTHITMTVAFILLYLAFKEALKNK